MLLKNNNLHVLRCPCNAPAQAHARASNGKGSQMQKQTALIARRVALLRAQAARPHSAAVEKLIQWCSDLLAIEESNDRLEWVEIPDVDLDAIEAAGPHGEPINSLVASYRDYWAEFERWENSAA